MKINAKHVNHFVEAAMEVVRWIAGIEVRRGHLSYKAAIEPSFGVSIVIGIYGFLTGQIVYSLDANLADRLVDKLLVCKSPQQKKILFMDSLVANMITGNATDLLNKKYDKVLNVTTPAQPYLSSCCPCPAPVSGLITPAGPIEIGISIEEKETLSEHEILESLLVET